MPETSIPLGGIHLKLLRLSLETRTLEKLDYLELLSLKAESLFVKIACSNDISGGYSDGVPPLPIPNREVKPYCADGTAYLWESRYCHVHKMGSGRKANNGRTLYLIKNLHMNTKKSFRK